MLRHSGATLEHGPAFRAAPQYGRIPHRIAVQDEQVGDRARTDPAQIVTPEELRVDRGGRLEQSQRSVRLGLQPQPLELLAVQRAHQVGPEPDPDPRLPGQPDRRPARVEDLAVLGLGHRGQAEFGTPPLQRVVGDQRRHQERVPFCHQGGGRRVQQVPVLDGADPLATATWIASDE